MKVTVEHHAIAESAFKSGKNTPQVQVILHNEGLTKSQANDCCRTARKHLGLYKKQTNQDKKNRAQREADEQANKKTQVDLDE